MEQYQRRKSYNLLGIIFNLFYDSWNFSSQRNLAHTTKKRFYCLKYIFFINFF